MAQEIWKKRVLIPFWATQLLICAFYTVVSVVALIAVGAAAANGDFSGDSPTEVIAALNIAAAVSLALSLFTIVVDLAEVVMLVRHKLRPVPNLILQCIKSTIWTVWFFLTVSAAAQGNPHPGGIVFAGLLFLSSIGLLIYGSIILHRHRTGTLYRGNYAPAAGGGHVNAQPYLAGGEQQSYTAYHPPSQGFYAPDPQPQSQPYGANPMYEMHNAPVREWP